MKRVCLSVPKLTAAYRCCHSVSFASLHKAYDDVKKACDNVYDLPIVDPRAVFTNNELNLNNIQVYGFDYDYTLAVYTRELNALIYKLALDKLVTRFKYPADIANISYDKGFAIRGLHFDIQNSCLLKVDAFSQIQRGTVFRGRRKLSDDEVRAIYPGFGLPDVKGRDFPQLIDLFSLPWAGLLATVIHYCDSNNIVFDPKCLYDDLAECVGQVHKTGEMYRHVAADLESYIHPNEGLKEYLEILFESNKELFVVTNSPFTFINTGMTYMLGEDWRKYFKYIVVSAKKPTFFYRREPFRLYDEATNALSFEKVSTLESGMIYAGGNIEELSGRAGFDGKGVLYFGDHIYTDLADPMLRLGWHTAAVVPELAREIRTQNQTEYRKRIQWLESLTHLIERFHVISKKHEDSRRILHDWMAERAQLREEVKVMFNPQFGSLFRTYNNMTYFSRRLNRLSDIYTSRVPNLQKYGVDHSFFSRRNALPHEAIHPHPVTLAPQEILTPIRQSAKAGMH